MSPESLSAKKGGRNLKKLFPVNVGIPKDITMSLIAFSHPLHPPVMFVHDTRVSKLGNTPKGAYSIASSLDFAAINVYGVVYVTVQEILDIESRFFSHSFE